ncbi:glycosyltransferase family 4 protein [Halomonas halodenitrificans]|uniref:glycosyltransferase family 4 protein n=1 Tax=Halomonas halodenitrificans TaxID=28252 RepID=UPI001FE15092|nr:glycosyltransferase family 4 protein [Halomonas halodenitrificans]
MRERLAGVENLEFVTANHQLAGHGAAGKAEIVHAHEAKAVHWACVHHLWFKVPYILTRRMNTPVKNRLSNRLCYSHAARRVAISSPIRETLFLRGWGDVDLIPSAMAGLSQDDAKTKAFRDNLTGKFIVGHAGALVDRAKGQRVLLEAARQLSSRYPDMHFVFLGQGEDEDILKHESLDMKNISWLGFKENIGDYIAGLDVFAFPSHYEGLGSVLLDVMDMGVPIIATDVGGIPDIVHHEQTGLLVADGDANALAECLARLHDDPSVGKALSNSARKQLANYTSTSMATSYLRLYNEIQSHYSG